jgi:hypothetical protein
MTKGSLVALGEGAASGWGQERERERERERVCVRVCAARTLWCKNGGGGQDGPRRSIRGTHRAAARCTESRSTTGTYPPTRHHRSMFRLRII